MTIGIPIDMQLLENVHICDRCVAQNSKGRMSYVQYIPRQFEMRLLGSRSRAETCVVFKYETQLLDLAGTHDSSRTTRTERQALNLGPEPESPEGQVGAQADNLRGIRRFNMRPVWDQQRCHQCEWVGTATRAQQCPQCGARNCLSDELFQDVLMATLSEDIDGVLEWERLRESFESLFT